MGQAGARRSILMRSRSRTALGSVLLVFGSAAALGGQAAPEVSLDQVVRVAGEYVGRYEQAMSAVVAQEDYRQVVLSRIATSRTLRSDLLVLDAGPRGWVSFRDVYDVDGTPVHDHDQRLSDLIGHFAPGSLQEARRIADEGARFNLNPVGVIINRNINTPMTALLFLRAASQGRSKFTLDKIQDVDGQRVAVVGFAEQTKPRLVGSRDDAAAHGQFWIDATTGRVLRTALQMETAFQNTSIATTIVVSFAQAAGIEAWVPLTMDESYELHDVINQSVKGHADYSHFRQFTVTMSEDGGRGH
jgi:hypothetical protein